MDTVHSDLMPAGVTIRDDVGT
ncbi:MAG: hypothetical protein QOI78_5422, partial [Actinomycetota bacterium]|nr:hypothetical protein [Actinomycetota bacterium]